MSTDSLLEIDHLSVTLPRWADRSHALDNISMTMRSNEIVCVVGELGPANPS